MLRLEIARAKTRASQDGSRRSKLEAGSSNPARTEMRRRLRLGGHPSFVCRRLQPFLIFPFAVRNWRLGPSALIVLRSFRSHFTPHDLLIAPISFLARSEPQNQPSRRGLRIYTVREDRTGPGRIGVGARRIYRAFGNSRRAGRRKADTLGRGFRRLRSRRCISGLFKSKRFAHDSCLRKRAGEVLDHRQRGIANDDLLVATTSLQHFLGVCVVHRERVTEENDLCRVRDQLLSRSP
jgi:hypothetical protein